MTKSYTESLREAVSKADTSNIAVCESLLLVATEIAKASGALLKQSQDLATAQELAGSYFDDVTDFLHTYDVPCSSVPVLPSKDIKNFGFNHLYEELDEIDAAFRRGDLVAASDGIGDLVYVALNFAARIGIPFNEIWKAIHIANITGKRKVKDASESKRNYEHDVIKTANFVAPEEAIKQALIKAGYEEQLS